MTKLVVTSALAALFAASPVLAQAPTGRVTHAYPRRGAEVPGDIRPGPAVPDGGSPSAAPTTPTDSQPPSGDNSGASTGGFTVNGVGPPEGANRRI